MTNLPVLAHMWMMSSKSWIAARLRVIEIREFRKVHTTSDSSILVGMTFSWKVVRVERDSSWADAGRPVFKQQKGFPLKESDWM